jgi:hypothetical protein
MILNLFFINIIGLKDAASAFEIRMVARVWM